MKRIAHYERTLNKNDKITPDDLLPCHYFDYMWGTSTGGLIAIMLGRLRMSVSQALSVYRDVGESIFGKRQRRALGGANVIATRYDHVNVERAVKKITRQYCRDHAAGTCTGSEDRLEWPDLSHRGVDNARDLCQAVCITARTSGKTSQALPLRSYHYEHHPSLASRDPNFGVEDLDLLIWEAARATSAAPFYFKMYEKRDKKGRLRRYKDGGTLVNNPAEKALNEVRDRYGLDNDGVRRDPAVLLSVGTGIRYDTPFAEMKSGEYAQSRRADMGLIKSIRERLAIAKHILMRYTEGEMVHRMIREWVGTEHLWYRRLNVDTGLGQMDLADWRKGAWRDSEGVEQQHSGGATLSDIEDATRCYLEREELHTEHEIEWFLLPSEAVDQVAERLVRHRMERRSLVQPGGDNERSWQTYQGRWASGRRADPWDNDSCDYPKSPGGSVEDLKSKGGQGSLRS